MNTSRGHSASPLRRASQYAICVGIVLAVASAFGPIWVVRAGILAAVVGGVLALRFAWREMREQHIEHGREINRHAHAQGAQLATERQRNSEVLEAMRAHNADADKTVKRLRAEIGTLNDELNGLRGENAHLKVDLIEREHRIERLRADLATREAELRALQEIEDDAEVLAMPRHAAGATGNEWDALPTAEELFAEGDHPTVVDLQKMVFPAIEQDMRKQA
ncbi:hypothetical protein GCM10027418_05480 [Mariniluteicoccus endophyticus]